MSIICFFKNHHWRCIKYTGYIRSSVYECIHCHRQYCSPSGIIVIRGTGAFEPWYVNCRRKKCLHFSGTASLGLPEYAFDGKYGAAKPRKIIKDNDE